MTTASPVVLFFRPRANSPVDYDLVVQNGVHADGTVLLTAYVPATKTLTERVIGRIDDGLPHRAVIEVDVSSPDTTRGRGRWDDSFGEDFSTAGVTSPFMTFLYGVAADRSWTGARATIQVDDVLLLPLP